MSARRGDEPGFTDCAIMVLVCRLDVSMSDAKKLLRERFPPVPNGTPMDVDGLADAVCDILEERGGTF